MKKIILMMVVVMAASVNMSEAAVSYFGPKIGVELEIGRRKYECTGFGICDFTVYGISFRPINGNTLNGYLEFDENNDILILTINKTTGISEEAFEKFFSSGKFKVSDNYEISDELVNKLGANSTITILSGEYKIIDDGKNYKIKFNL